MERSLIRLKRSFQLEKEEALLEEVEALWRLRERSRSHYQPSALSMINNIRQLRYKMSRIKHIPSAILPRLELLEKAIKEALAHFSGTPNRLLRSAGQNTGDD